MCKLNRSHLWRESADMLPDHWLAAHGVPGSRGGAALSSEGDPSTRFTRDDEVAMVAAVQRCGVAQAPPELGAPQIVPQASHWRPVRQQA
jgi:hypothetical protein